MTDEQHNTTYSKQTIKGDNEKDLRDFPVATSVTFRNKK